MSTRKRTIAQALAGTIAAIRNCEKNGNTEWHARHTATLESIMDSAPSGSGIDSGTQIELDRCNGRALVFSTAYHHMTEHGFYDGWTDHKVTARASFVYGVELTISGRDRNEIKDYLAECFQMWLATEHKESE